MRPKTEGNLVLAFYKEHGRWPRGNVQDEMNAWLEKVVRERDELRAQLAAIEGAKPTVQTCTYPECNCPIDKTTVCARGLPDDDS